jgi:hypothetical protein
LFVNAGAASRKEWHYFGVLQAVVNFPHAGADLGMLTRMIDVAMAGWPANDKLPQPVR